MTGVKASIEEAISKNFEEMAPSCEFIGPNTLAQWKSCDCGNHPFAMHAYAMCREDYCPRLR